MRFTTLLAVFGAGAAVAIPVPTETAAQGATTFIPIFLGAGATIAGTAIGAFSGFTQGLLSGIFGGDDWDEDDFEDMPVYQNLPSYASMPYGQQYGAPVVMPNTNQPFMLASQPNVVYVPVPEGQWYPPPGYNI